MHLESQSMYLVEVSKVVGPSWLFIPEKSVGGLGGNRDQYLPRNAGVHANLEGIHTISWTVCVSL